MSDDRIATFTTKVDWWPATAKAIQKPWPFEAILIDIEWIRRARKTGFWDRSGEHAPKRGERAKVWGVDADTAARAFELADAFRDQAVAEWQARQAKRNAPGDATEAAVQAGRRKVEEERRKRGQSPNRGGFR